MPRKILVVDDKPVMIRLIQHHLEKAGYVLIQARNRKEAAEVVERERPGLVVVDDSTNGKEGMHSHELKKNGAKVPVIRMTDDPKRLETQPGSSDDIVLSKPFSPSKLVDEIKRLSSAANKKT